MAVFSKKLLLISILMLIVVAVLVRPVSATVQPSETPVHQCVYFFYAEGCGDCEVAQSYITQMEQQFPLLTVTQFELHNSSNYDLMMQYENYHNITSYVWPVVFIGNNALVGVDQIETELQPLLLNNTGWVCPSINSTVPPYKQPSPPVFLIFGLAFADSLNPCAITVLILLLVALSAASKSVWKTGIAYILGNFLVYIAIGFGLFTVLQQFNLPTYTSKVIGAAAIILAVISLFSKLPEQSKPTIKKLLTAATSPYFAFVAGAAISAIELPCTGGPYFLALTLIREYNITGVHILGYLILYNLIFVLPLVAVLLVYGFAKSPKIPKKYIRWISALLMVIMGAILLIL